MYRFQLNEIQIPKSVKVFSFKIILLLILWEVLYSFILFPARIPDKQLSSITAAGTAKLINLFYPNDLFEYRSLEEGEPKSFKETVFFNHQKLIGIADGCNALELQVLYFGILICLQKLTHKTLWYSLFGVTLISVCNIMRCSIICWLNISRHLDLSVFAHHYLFKMLMYGLIFWGWVSYSSSKQQHA
ncbi:MAG: archaeosortase/exosortase family protein [Bacteroidetes bacterium]|nr:archaeosortase/exosortase family protein [Bacteroidota bacterium]